MGLSEYQARAYVALLTLGAGVAGDVAAASGVPQSRLYGVLKDLEVHGLAESVLGPPTRYKATPIDAFLKRQAAELRARAEVVEAEGERLAREIRPAASPRDAPGGIGVVRGKRNILLRAHELARGAKSSLTITGTGVLADEGLSRGLVSALKERSGAGVRARVVLPVPMESLERARRLARHADVRHNDAAGSSFSVVVDGTRALLGTVAERAGAVKAKEMALVVEEPGLAAFASDAFEHLWQTGVDLAERASVLSGKEARRVELARSPQDALAELRALVAGAEESLDVLTSAMGAYQALALKPELAGARARGVAVRIATPRTRANEKARAELARLADVRSVDEAPVRFFLADGKRALVIDPGSMKDSPFLDANAFGPLTLVTTHPGIVEMVRVYFERAWGEG